MKKYYTPEIEEFHVGFEFYIEDKKYCLGENSEETIHFFSLANSRKINISDKVKVKYLDKEDIESLGFSQKPIGYELGLLSRTEWGAIQGNEMIKIQTYWTYDTEERENLVRIYKGTKYDYPYTEIFRGIIKNKSELKKLLKQLKIID